MQWLVNYIRSWFCKHDWERYEVEIEDLFDGVIKHKVVMICRKCGFKKSNWL